MMRAAFVALLACGCGRLGFDGRALGDGGAGDGDARDDGTTDAVPDVIPPSTPGPTDFVMYWDWETQTALGGGQSKYPDYTNTRAGSCTADCPGLGVGQFNAAVAITPDQEIVIPSEPRLNTSTAFTISVWVNVQSPLASTGGCVVSKPYATDTANSWALCVQPPNTFVFFSSSNGGPNANVGGVSGALDAWHHISLTWDGAIKRIRVDGSFSAATSAAATAVDSGPILIGFDIDNTVRNSHFKGRIDELRIYDRALSTAELDALAGN